MGEMSSAKRKWSDEEAQKNAKGQAQLAKRKAELEARFHELQLLLDERNVLKEQTAQLSATFINYTVKVEKADRAERDEMRVEREVCRQDLLRYEENLKGFPEREKILSQMQEFRSLIEEIESQIQDLSTPTYMESVLAAGSPSAVEKQGLYNVQMRSPNGPLYQCCFPASAQPPLPASLAHHVFGEFLDDFSDVSTPLNDDVCNFVVDLCFDVLGRMQKFGDEAEFQKAVILILEGFLGHAVTIDVVSLQNNKATTDLTVRTGVHWIIFGELKLERGCTVAHVLQYLAYYAGSRQVKTELLPCFSIEVIGPTIRIGGFNFFEKVAWQPLTPFINCFYTEYDRTDMATVCRAMRALKKGLITLDSYYKQAPSTRTITHKDIPYPLQGRNSVRRIGNKLVFIVTRDNGECRIFKYCRQYGERVHRSWADAGLAPILYDCKPISGGWLEVEMEYLADWNPSSSLLIDMDGAARRNLREAISASLRLALAIPIDGSLVAHGDMRPPNIMIKKGDGGCFDIKFIDFDWAGEVGVARYPPFMNTALPWHRGVGAGKELAQDHDTFWWMEPHTGPGLENEQVLFSYCWLCDYKCRYLCTCQG